MIFLWGLLEDTPMSMVCDELDSRGANYFFLDHRKIFDADIEYTYSGHKRPRCLLHTDGQVIDMQDVKVAYCRPYNFRDYPQMLGRSADDPVALKAAGFEAQLLTFINALDGLVLNRSDPSASNNSKPYQLSVIRRSGLKVPETFISNDSDAVADFLSRHPDVIYKSISGVRSIVQAVSDTQLEYLDDVKWCPTLFQKKVPGINYRVHVLGTQLFAVRIESDRVDYRYGNTTMTVEELPEQVAMQCLTLNQLLGLHFSGIDLMRTPEEEWFCFEVNPSPAFSYFQYYSGLPISSALAACMIEADRSTQS